MTVESLISSKRKLPLSALKKVKDLIQQLNAGDFLKKSLVFSLKESRPLMTHWSFSAKALEEKMFPDVDLKADVSLFYQLRPLMDRNLLCFVPERENLCLSLTVKTVLKEELSGFRNLTVLLDVEDVFQDVEAYEKAYLRLKEKGCKVAIDTHANELQYLDADALDADFLCVPAGMSLKTQTPLIWKGCPNSDYLTAGKEKGVFLFEGSGINAFCQALEGKK